MVNFRVTRNIRQVGYMVIHNSAPVGTIRISHQSDKITIRAMGLSFVNQS
ncbi:MAG: hypothetical protein QOK69_01630 [Nitrososphaeraceae archaeon]|nr:hypothetical protein [Nitrososphaeraceae archaeon]